MAGSLSTNAPMREAKSRGEEIARTPQFEWLARAGLAARGVVYIVIGILALKVAFGSGGKTTNQQGALQEIAQQPFGKALLVLVAIGLFGYAAWRLIRAGIGHGPEGADDFKERIDGVFSGLGYGALFVTAVKIIAGSGGGNNSNNGADKTTGGVLDWPGGKYLVMLVGAIIIGVGIDQGIKGVKKKFLENSKTGEMSPRVKQGFTALGVAGHLSRMVVFGLIGYFLIKAALDFDPNKAVALDGALARLRHADYGPVLLGLVAAGLVCFGAYSFADARYRKV